MTRRLAAVALLCSSLATVALMLALSLIAPIPPHAGEIAFAAVTVPALLALLWRSEVI